MVHHNLHQFNEEKTANRRVEGLDSRFERESSPTLGLFPGIGLESNPQDGIVLAKRRRQQSDAVVVRRDTQ